MSYRLLAHETIPQGIRRIVHEQIDKTTAELTDDALNRDESVHQARKRFKKIRGVLRLVRPALEATYKAENTYYRDLGRRLSRARDAAVLIETYDQLLDAYGAHRATDAFRTVRTHLVEHKQAVIAEEEVEGRIRTIRTDLKEARQRVASWPLTRDGFATLGPGLKKTYRRGRKAFAVASEESTFERLHEWRKRVKYHRYHLRLLQNTWPRPMKSCRHAAKDLSDYLGDHHNLAVLRHTLLDRPDAFGSERDLQVLMGLIDQRQVELASRSETLGQRIFVEKPKHLHRRISAYWAAWRTETRRAILFNTESLSRR